ncbi:hypothetical protein I3F58_09155 [Streptomyces sp. MUM 203J]|uniref:DUF6777 domain-containing protein n=1 Tax=Streptomyces sp. MUM 203J TaxID=2791990 RepID=UPI001F0403F7|nr:DUF6777 domain-containing protein [Streptomyces sp. MUM 203J]MCH0539727.1 hypothetical protein [Streptomyces sp. MUM 203J]
MSMRSFTRRRCGPYAVLAAVTGLLAAGCGGAGDGTPASRDGTGPARTTLLQAADRGPDPFTASTVLTSDVAPKRGSGPDASPDPAGSAAPPPPRTVDGATPGLYGAAQSLPSCDIEQQAGFLAADSAKAGAFARAAGINQSGLAAWLRGLTSVMLRADTRVTGHGYRDGAPVPYPAVLQAGTAVLVDAYGAPRVRCADGSPLRTPDDGRPAGGGARHEGRAWAGYAPERVIAVQPTVRTLDSLIVVNVVNESWLERAVGTTGEQDREPGTPPAYRPADRPVADAAVPDASGGHDVGREGQVAAGDPDGLLVGPVNVG